MKMITRAGILSLAFVLAFMFTAAVIEVAAESRFFPPADKGYICIPGISMQAKHDFYGEEYQITHISKHDFTLKKGQSYTLKASLLPSGKSISVEWKSSNPKIAEVSNTGRVTAVAPGAVIIWFKSEKYEYWHDNDETGFSDECFVTVEGGAKDIKALGANEWTYYYGNTKLAAVASKHYEALAKVKQSIGGYIYNDVSFWGDEYKGLLFGSKNKNKAHTDIFVEGPEDDSYVYGFIARGKSPLKTSRGIMVGSAKSTVKQKYGLPTFMYKYKEDGKIYMEDFSYYAKTAGENQYTILSFTFQQPTSIVMEISFYLGGRYMN